MFLEWTGVVLTTVTFVLATLAGRGTSASKVLGALVGMAVGGSAGYSAAFRIAEHLGGPDAISVRRPSGTLLLLVVALVPVGAIVVGVTAYLASRRFPASVAILSSAIVFVGVALTIR